MSNNGQPYRLIISGGGTGGHIFPAIAIANSFRERYPSAQILFVGAKGRMEMTRVPDAGYKIIGLWISGLQRKLTLSNLLFPVKVIVSYMRAAMIIKRYKPHAVIGTGGYASGPIMMAATRFGVPAIIQEQNSFAGLANKQVADKASKVCVAYDGMEKYFPKEKIVLTGNPVRKDIISVGEKRARGLGHFGFESGTKTLLIIGGSREQRNEALSQARPPAQCRIGRVASDFARFSAKFDFSSSATFDRSSARPSSCGMTAFVAAKLVRQLHPTWTGHSNCQCWRRGASRYENRDPSTADYRRRSRLSRDAAQRF